MMHSPELMLLLHNVDRRELYAELHGRAARPGRTRRAWSAAGRALSARTGVLGRPARSAVDPCGVAPCAA